MYFYKIATEVVV